MKKTDLNNVTNETKQLLSYVISMQTMQQGIIISLLGELMELLRKNNVLSSKEIDALGSSLETEPTDLLLKLRDLLALDDQPMKVNMEISDWLNSD